VLDSSSRRTRNVVAYDGRGLKKNRRRFSMSRSKLPLLIITLLMLYISFSLGTRFDQLNAMQQDLRAMQAEIKELRGKNVGLQDKLEKLQSNAYIEQVAREKLGLVKPGEDRIVPVSPGAGEMRRTSPAVELKD